MNENNQYIKFMSDIIDSGVWAELSAGARTLYPVLLKFSDQNFKHVWPSTKTLMKLTGFKTKKSIIEAKKDLISAGLIQVRSGTGHSNSVYYFCFNYKGSKIKPQWDKKISPQGTEKDTSEMRIFPPVGAPKKDSNQINITITNNNHTNTKKEKISANQSIFPLSVEQLLELYGKEVFDYAYEKALSIGLQANLEYVSMLCKERVRMISLSKNNQKKDYPQANWISFLSWASEKLTYSTLNVLKNLQPVIDGNFVYIKEPLPPFLKEIINKYFREIAQDRAIVIFKEEEKEGSRID